MIATIRTSFSDLFHYREVITNLVSAQLALKYRRTYFGYLWSLLNPILQLTVLSVVFSHVVRLDMKNYVAYLFSGILAWNFFAGCIQTGAWSFVENEAFIKKVYLPKLIFPLCRVTLCLVDFLSALVALTLIVLVLGIPLSWTILLVPVALVSLILFSFGMVIFVSVATVYFRDVYYLVSVALQLLYFLTPIIYPFSVLPPHYQVIMRLNPLVSQVQLFQRLIYDGRVPSGAEWASAFLVSVVTFIASLLFLKRVEDELVFRL